MNFLKDFGRSSGHSADEEMSKPDSSGKQYLGYFKATPFLESGSLGYRKQHRDGLNEECQKYYGVVRSQNDAHNGKAVETACERSINFYNEIMEDGLKIRYRDEGTMDDKEIQSLHEFSLQKAMDKFQETAKLAPEHIWRECRDRIMEKCKTRFEVISAENEERNKQIIERAKQKSFSKYKTYVDAIVKVRREVDDMIGDHELRRVHEEAMRAAMGSYDNSSMIGAVESSSQKGFEARAIEWWN